jgi:hypothetical protein
MDAVALADAVDLLSLVTGLWFDCRNQSVCPVRPIPFQRVVSKRFLMRHLWAADSRRMLALTPWRIRRTSCFRSDLRQANLLDGDPGTFSHSRWHVKSEVPDQPFASATELDVILATTASGPQ